jgi:hypothetical protein
MLEIDYRAKRRSAYAFDKNPAKTMSNEYNWSSRRLTQVKSETGKNGTLADPYLPLAVHHISHQQSSRHAGGDTGHLDPHVWTHYSHK